MNYEFKQKQATNSEVKDQIIEYINKGYGVQTICEILETSSKEVQDIMLNEFPTEANEHDWRGEYGELEYCLKCKALEGSTPTDCPDKSMTAEQSDAVYAGGTDFRKEEGWVRKLSPMGSSMVQGWVWDKLLGRERADRFLTYGEMALHLGVPYSEINEIVKKEQKYYLTKYQG